MKAPALAHHCHFISTSRIPTTNLSRRATAPKFTVRISLQENAPSLAVVGVPGAVGQEFLSILSDRNFPYQSIKMLASKRSAGKHITFQDKDHVIEEHSFDGVDIPLFSAGGSISKQFGPIAVGRGPIVVNNSSAFRMDENVPLVIPEVNPDAIEHTKLGCEKGALIANPICSTMICLTAATPLHRSAKESDPSHKNSIILWDYENTAIKQSYIPYFTSALKDAISKEASCDIKLVVGVPLFTPVTTLSRLQQNGWEVQMNTTGIPNVIHNILMAIMKIWMLPPSNDGGHIHLISGNGNYLTELCTARMLGYTISATARECPQIYKDIAHHMHKVAEFLPKPL